MNLRLVDCIGRHESIPAWDATVNSQLHYIWRNSHLWTGNIPDVGKHSLPDITEIWMNDNMLSRDVYNVLCDLRDTRPLFTMFHVYPTISRVEYMSLEYP